MVIKNTKKHPVMVVLDALLAGQPVDLPLGKGETRTVRLFRKGDIIQTWTGEEAEVTAPYWLATQATHVRMGADKQHEIWVDLDGITLGSFIQMCEQMPFDDLFLLGANAALRKIHARERQITE